MGRHLYAGIIAVAALAALAGAALMPIHVDSREAVYVIPKGTWAKRMAGEKLDVLPEEIRLTLGVRDVLVLRNQDDVPQMFGPVLIMPGQGFSLPFKLATSYQFACSLHVNGQLSVLVQPNPAPGWERLRWRVSMMASA
jgi:hypothetical protein